MLFSIFSFWDIFLFLSAGSLIFCLWVRSQRFRLVARKILIPLKTMWPYFWLGLIFVIMGTHPWTKEKGELDAFFVISGVLLLVGSLLIPPSDIRIGVGEREKMKSPRKNV